MSTYKALASCSAATPSTPPRTSPNTDSQCTSTRSGRSPSTVTATRMPGSGQRLGTMNGSWYLTICGSTPGTSSRSFILQLPVEPSGLGRHASTISAQPSTGFLIRFPRKGHTAASMAEIRPCRDDERDAILTIVNAAAEAYRGAIPRDRFHDPYMPADELAAEIAAGVAFWGYEDDDELLGVMGVQRVKDVVLIRHAYVAPAAQRRGVGSALLEHLLREQHRPVLVGTWAAAEWAIAFYRRHGFEPASQDLLRTYWTIPERQIETSVVLAHGPR